MLTECDHLLTKYLLIAQLLFLLDLLHTLNLIKVSVQFCGVVAVASWNSSGLSVLWWRLQLLHTQHVTSLGIHHATEPALSGIQAVRGVVVAGATDPCSMNACACSIAMA